MAGKLTERTIDALLDRLAADDDFRARFMANPRDATRSLGTADPAVDALPSEPLQRLAPKESFRGSRDQHRRKLVESMSPFVPITLDVAR